MKYQVLGIVELVSNKEAVLSEDYDNIYKLSYVSFYEAHAREVQ